MKTNTNTEEILRNRVRLIEDGHWSLLGTLEPQSANTVEHNMTMLDSVEGLPLKTMYATIAMAKMMYVDYQEKAKLKAQVEAYESKEQQ